MEVFSVGLDYIGYFHNCDTEDMVETLCYVVSDVRKPLVIWYILVYGTKVGLLLPQILEHSFKNRSRFYIYGFYWQSTRMKIWCTWALSDKV